MLIVKIIKRGKQTYHGCESVSVERVDEETQRVKLFSSSGMKRVIDLRPMDSVELLNDRVFLL